MKRILLMAPSVVSAGGVEKLIDNMSQLLANDYDVSIASFDPPDCRPFFGSKVPFYPLGGGVPVPFFSRVFEYIVVLKRLSVLKRRLGVDLTISVLWRADLINFLSRQRDRLISLAVINIVNNPTNIKMVRFRGFVGHIYRQFDRVFAITPVILQELMELYSIERGRLGLFKSFSTPPVADPYFSGDRPRFVFCGRAVHEKNIDGLLHVFARFLCGSRNYQLVLIGDGPLLAEMKSLALVLGLSVGTEGESDAQVLFVGATATPEAFMLNARALLLTSRHEGVPTVAILAAGLGLPIIAADCLGGGLRVLFNVSLDEPLSHLEMQDGLSAGFLLPVPDPSLPATLDAWVKAMDLVDQNVFLRERFRAGALQLAVSHSPRAVHEEWVLALESVFSS